MADVAVNLNDEQLAEFLQKNQEKLIVLDFFATWCGPCQMAGPVLEELAREYRSKQVVIAKIDIDEASQSVAQYGVRSVPTLVFLQNGQEVERLSGFLGKRGFEKVILKHLKES